MRTRGGTLLRALLPLILMFAPAACRADLPELIDRTACEGLPAALVTLAVEQDSLRFDMAPGQSELRLRVMFARPLATAGKDRLSFEGRCPGATGLGTCVAYVKLLGAGGGEAQYEPDIQLPPVWNWQSVMFSDFEGDVPPLVRGLEFRIWEPDRKQAVSLWLKRVEFLAQADVAARVSRPTGPARPAQRARASRIPPEHRRWTQFGPGGGGWYRVVAISPHTGHCFVGSDVGGVCRSTDTGLTWRVLNTGLPHTYVNAFAFHPTNPCVVLVGCNAGLAKSTDNGETWVWKRNGFPPVQTFGFSAPVSALSYHPSQPDIVYAGVGHERDYGELGKDTLGGRVFTSADGGETWQMRELPGGEAARRLSAFCFRFHPRDPTRIYLSTQAGLFESRDAGAAWAPLGQGLSPYHPAFLAIGGNNPDTMLLAYHDGPDGRGGVLRSTDGGVTWQERNLGLPKSKQAWRLVSDPRDPNTFYVGWHHASGLFVTRDGGDSWHGVNMSGNMDSPWSFPSANVTGLDIDPRNPKRIVYCNDMEIYQSLDGGASWQQAVTRLIHQSTADRPAVWQTRGPAVLCSSGPQGLIVDPSDPRILYFGYMDVLLWKSDDAGRTCHRLTSGIGSGFGRVGAMALDPADSRILYVSAGHNYSDHRIYKSVDAGRTFHMIGARHSGLPRGAFFTLRIDPSSPPDRRTLYATATKYGPGLYKSTDGGLSWSGLTNGLPQGDCIPSDLAIDPGNTRRLFLTARWWRPAGGKRQPGYVARSADGGLTWEVVKTGCEPEAVLIDPFDSRKVYVSNRNYSGYGYPHAFYKSADGGTTWSSLDQAPFLEGPGSREGDKGPRVDLCCLAADPLTPGTLYVAARGHWYDVSGGLGVFKSTDWGETWTPFDRDGLTHLSISTLVVDPVDPSRLYVGTGGNGFFRYGPAP